MRRYKINEKVGKRIRRTRRQLGFSQEELADRAGMHLSTLGRIERGESNPPVHTVSKIAKALKTSVDELFK